MIRLITLLSRLMLIPISPQENQKKMIGVVELMITASQN